MNASQADWKSKRNKDMLQESTRSPFKIVKRVGGNTGGNTAGHTRHPSFDLRGVSASKVGQNKARGSKLQ